MNDSRRWWHGPTPEESEKLTRAADDVHAAVAPLLRALADDVRKLAERIARRITG